MGVSYTSCVMFLLPSPPMGNYTLELRYLLATTAIDFLLKLLASLNQVFSHCENIPERLKSIIYNFFKLICGWLLCPWYLPHYSLL